MIAFRLIFGCVYLLLASGAAAAPDNPHPFAEWLDAFKQEAAAQGIAGDVLNNAFANTQPIDRVIVLDRKQPEKTLTLEEYLAKIVSDKRIQNGKDRLDENRELLEKVSQQYNVPPNIIVALWGIETNYGENTGGFDIIDSLATLAYDGRRSDFFRKELLSALKIMQSEKRAADEMQGSWAGAMGQCQFMPSSYLRYAVDFDNDGHRDIWQSDADIFASIANYLHSEGWNDDAENNFNVLLKWNRSRYFATAVMQIADGIGG